MQAFDELLLLKPGGSTIYFGPLGDESADLLAYFQALPGVTPCPHNYNPANWCVCVGGVRCGGGGGGGMKGCVCVCGVVGVGGGGWWGWGCGGVGGGARRAGVPT
jgi:hypothetical protein